MVACGFPAPVPLVKLLCMNAAEEKTILSGAAGTARHSALAPALFLLAALIALASGLVGPASASAKTLGSPPNRVWKNCVGTVRYESVGFIGQMHRHIATKAHIATGYAGSPTAIPARHTVVPTTPQQPHASRVRAATKHFGRDPSVRFQSNTRYDSDTQYDPSPGFCIAAESAAGKLAGFIKHSLNEAIDREGVGVSNEAILDAVKNQEQVVAQSVGLIKYIGKNATVLTNADGKVVSILARSSTDTRIPPGGQ